MKYSTILKKLHTEPSSHFSLLIFLFLFQVISILFISFEFYKEAIITILLFFGFLSFYFRWVSIYILTFISLALEGKWIENFVLFRLFGFNWYLIDLTFLITFLNLILLLRDSYEKLIFDKIMSVIFLFIIVTIFSAFNGLRAGHLFQAVFYDFRGFFYYLYFFPTIILFDSKERINKFLFFIILIITLKSLLDIYLSLFVYEKSFDIETRQVLGFARLTGYNEIVYSLSFVGSFFLIVFHKNCFSKLLFLFVLIISMISLFLSYTRGSWLAAGITLIFGLFFLVLNKNSKLNFKIIIPIFSLLIFVIFFFDLIKLIDLNVLINRISTVSISRIDISNLGRLVEYASAIEAFKENPIFGKGLGFLFVYFSPGIGSVESIYCHNSYLYVLSKMGLLGLIFFLAIIIISIYPLFKIKNFIFKEEFYSSAFIFFLWLILISIKSLTTWHLNTNTFSPFVGVLFGLAIRIKYFYQLDHGR